jgi:hypothetical protein
MTMMVVTAATKDVGKQTNMFYRREAYALLVYHSELEGYKEQIARVNGREWARPPFSILCREARLVA